MLESIVKRLKNNDYRDLRGQLRCKIPFSIDVMNVLLNKAQENNNAVKELKVVSIDGDIITFKLTLGGLKFAKKLNYVDRKLKLKIDPVMKAPDWVLKIEVLDGIKRLENEIVELLFNTRLKNSLFDFEKRLIYINHSNMFDSMTYKYFIDHLESAQLITQPTKIFYTLHFNFGE